jgi:hypothetical protein
MRVHGGLYWHEERAVHSVLHTGSGGPLVQGRISDCWRLDRSEYIEDVTNPALADSELLLWR